MQTYTLPDGRTIKVGPERFMAPEAMFDPRLIDQECEGLSDIIFSCIRVCPRFCMTSYVQARLRCAWLGACTASLHMAKSEIMHGQLGMDTLIFAAYEEQPGCLQSMDVDNRMAMYQHIVLSGGSSMFGGMPNRLERDIRGLYLKHTLQVRLHIKCAQSVRNMQHIVESRKDELHIMLVQAVYGSTPSALVTADAIGCVTASSSTALLGCVHAGRPARLAQTQTANR